MNNKVIVGIVIAVAAVAAILMVVGIIATQNDSSTTHSVIYDGNGGTVKDLSQYVRDETNFDGSITAYWSGHQFNGWYKDKSCTEKMEDGMKLTSAITVYAGWISDYKLERGTEFSLVGPEGIFSIVAKNGNVPIDYTFRSCKLPDSGTTRIVATAGTDFEVIKDLLNEKYLKFKYDNGETTDTYFVSVVMSNIKGDITVGIDESTNMGYFEFSYYADVSMNFEQMPYGIGYNAHEGEFSDTGESGKAIGSLTVMSDTELSLVAPEGYIFEGWYSKEIGGTKYDVGEEIDFSGEFVKLHAHYTKIPS